LGGERVVGGRFFDGWRAGCGGACVDAGEAGDIFYVWGRGGTRRRPTLRLGFGSCHFVVCGWKLLVWGGKWKPCPKLCLDICSSINHSKRSVDVIIAIELKTIRLFTSSTTNIKNADTMTAIRIL
jgi:hypothetical protein